MEERENDKLEVDEPELGFLQEFYRDTILQSIKELHDAINLLTADDPLKLYYQVEEAQRKLTKLWELARSARIDMLQPLMEKVIQLTGPQLHEEFQVEGKLYAIDIGDPGIPF